MWSPPCVRARPVSRHDAGHGRSPGIAFAEMREKPPGPYSKVYDERQGYIGFTLAGSSIRAKTVSLEGEVMDQWTQKLKSKEF